MPVFITTLLSMFTGAFGPLMNWAQQKIEFQQKIQLESMKLEGQIEQSEAKSAGERLKSTGRVFKYFTFFMWFYPFFVCQVSSKYALVVFNNLALLPPWYTNSCVILMFAIWGISVSAPVVNGIFSGLGQYIADKRDHKERLAKINRGLVFDELRKDSKDGKLNDGFVNIVDKALDAADANIAQQENPQ